MNETEIDPDSDLLYHYQDNLRHVARPSDPSERRDAMGVALNDYEALYLLRGLNEYAAYDADSERSADVAMAYADYVHYQVREMHNSKIRLYAHTGVARDVLRGAVSSISSQVQDLHHGLVENVEASMRDSEDDR